MKKIKLLFLFWITALAGFSQGALIYQDCNYRGKSQLLRPGRYNLDQIGFGAFQASSIKLYSGYKVILYNGNEPGTGNRKITLTTSVPCFGSDWNDKVGSIIVEEDYSGGGNNQAVQQPSYPSYGNGPQVILYEDCSLRGNNRSLTPGRYNKWEMGIRSDALSSLRIPSGYSVTIYKDENFRGGSQTYYSNVYCLDGAWNDQATSVVISGPGNNYNNYNPPVNNNNNYPSARDKVQVYDQCDYSGASFAFSPGRYNHNTLGIGSDRISSVRIPNGFKITVYQNKDFSGYSRTFYGDEYCLDGQWNDQISSMIVDGPGTNNSNQNNSNQNNSSPGYNYGNNNAGVNVYTDSYYKGNHAVFNEGRHNLRNSRVSNNISSFTLQPGYRITVYEDFEFRGRSQSFTSSVLNLNIFGWNDNIRSIIVTRDY